ncbi:lipoate--protein ligase family protein [Motiliproteus sediminis]|uniref:lipoate--protein ligase family protein n=1 Tax=Motiliproteus sediminis TaxID=1468178 RepID=UPI001AEF6322|nr:lipoate--protein ligase family protein [Motiliproteus sediminis]
MNPTDCIRLFQLQQHWLLRDDPLTTDTAANIAVDTHLLRKLQPGQGIARLWENPRSLVITRRETRLPRYSEACVTLAQAGWPVVVRDSGGTAVPHEPGVLHLSLIFTLPADYRYDLDLVYQALCEPIKRAFSALGVESEFGNVPDAYCDGRYNLIVNGRKITGTAQRLIPLSGGGHGVLAQAMINVTTDVETGNERVNQFYALAGDPRHYRSDASTSLDRELQPVPKALAQRLRDEILRALSTLIKPLA